MTTSPQSPPGPIRVGPYTLLNRLGEGGMGVVHLARRDDGHRVALKVLRPHIIGDDEARERLAREVNSLGRIRSRWVAEIVDADPWGPIPYVATRYVPGLSLHDHVRRDGPVDDVAWFAARLADGLSAVHLVDVLHRDVKPSNVLLEGRAPILIDFGLARVADDPRLTHTGWLLGTPGYLAPEILYGDDATAASDVHSWAATVVYAGTGRPPFGRGPSVAVMDRVRRGEHDLSGLSPEVRDLVQHCLAPDPLERPTLREIIAELTELLADDPLASEVLAEEADEPPLTVPLVAAAAVDPTEVHVAPTRVLTGATRPELAAAPPEPAESLEPEPAAHQEAADEDEWDPGWGPLPESPPRPDPWPVRARHALLAFGLLAVAAIGTGLAPYVTVGLLLAVAWLLRAGSLAGSRHRDRRDRRGARWWDVLALPLSYPWYFVAAIPGWLLLALWSAGLAAAAGLICYALAASPTTTLAATGAVFAGSLWWGPGGSRVAGPVQRVLRPLSVRPGVWAVAFGVLTAVAVAGSVLVSDQGVSWAPAGDGPFPDGWFLGASAPPGHRG